MHAVDISPEVLDVAERGVYSPEASEMVHSSIFEGLTETERAEMFDWEGDDGPQSSLGCATGSRGRSATLPIRT